MSETPSQYKTNSQYEEVYSDERGYAQSIMMQMPQIAKLSDLRQSQGRKQSPIVRDAIDLYFKIENDPRLIEMAELAQISKDELLGRAINLLYSKIETLKSSK